MLRMLHVDSPRHGMSSTQNVVAYIRLRDADEEEAMKNLSLHRQAKGLGRQEYSHAQSFVQIRRKEQQVTIDTPGRRRQIWTNNGSEKNKRRSGRL